MDSISCFNFITLTTSSKLIKLVVLSFIDSWPFSLLARRNIRFFFSFLGGSTLQHMEVPRLGVELELQLPAYTTATVMSGPSHIFDLCHSFQQCWILNPLGEARYRTCILMYTSWVLNLLSHNGNSRRNI